MAYARSEARINEDVLLIAEFRTPAGNLVDPHELISVDLLDTDGQTVLQHISSEDIERELIGTYSVIGLGEHLDVGGLYFDRWSFVLNDGEPAQQIELNFLVREHVEDVPLGPSDLCLLTARFVGLQGALLVGVKVFVQNRFVPSLRGGRAVLGDDLVVESDDNGMASFSLVRLSQVTVSLGGSGITKDIVVPDSATADLLTLLGEAPDLFTVVQDNTQPLEPEGV